MATLDSDVPMVPAGEPSSSAGPSSKKPKRFEIKKWNAVALWAWDIVVDNCASCRNHITNEEEAKKKIYNVSCERYFGFGCQIDEETSNKLEGLPGVLFVLPVSQFPLMWISGFLFLSYKNSGISSLSMAAKTFNFILFLPLLSLVVGHGTMELEQYPLVVSTRPFVEAVRAAWRAVDAGSSAVDSVVEGCSACEELRCDGTAIKLWKA